MSADIGTVELFVDGDWRPGGAGRLDVVDPATERAAGSVSLAAASDLDDALAAAGRAFGAWAATPAHERGAVLIRAAEILRERVPAIAQALSTEAGKLPAEASGELARAADTLQWNGEEAGRIQGHLIPGRARGSERLSQPEPVGVVAAFAAWNFPAVLASRKLGAALAAGCSVVFKAAEETPRTAAEIVRAIADAGAPPGTVNLVFGDPPQVSEHLIDAPVVRAVTFTGSTAVGRRIAALAARGPKRAVLELGGHAPVIVCDDGDVELAVTATMAAKFGSAGQSCVAPSRWLVHAGRYDEFVERFAAAASALQVGAPGEDGAQLGPVISAQRLEALRRLTGDAVERGAVARCGGERVDRGGFFWAPTVLADVPADALVMHEEPFGPIACMTAFDDLDEAIGQANDTDYAFAAYVFTDSMTARARVISDVRATNVGINQMAPSMPDAPLGGAQDSGFGYEGGRAGIHAFQQFRLISQTTP
ncbi:MAG: NAD-dependent succinate-semialdehyde dehydrogenase [Solirubrobacteraceae bacterium]